ncbi:MAG: TetR/AcrR family transcriptional regulator [Flammeovirgaceae bacterium]|nr:TetR/AcrR family transcriptional regulator [Flammeovirgaceae bacterium]MDW8287757.1 TetR/AcrR family transcriptional regulator [Flammeovirgaceae bacterium]
MTEELDKNEAVKERILLTSMDLFKKFGIKSVTMEDIAKKLGISKKTIYAFFKDKDELIESAARRQLEIDKAALEQIADESSSIIIHLVKISELIKQRMSEFHPVMIYDLQKYYPRAWQLYVSHRQDCQEQFLVTALEQGIKEGVFRPTIDVKALARMRLFQIELAFNPEVFPASEFNILHVQMQFFEHFVYGLCTEKGYEILQKYLSATS